VETTAVVVRLIELSNLRSPDVKPGWDEPSLSFPFSLQAVAHPAQGRKGPNRALRDVLCFDRLFNLAHGALRRILNGERQRGSATFDARSFPSGEPLSHRPRLCFQTPLDNGVKEFLEVFPAIAGQRPSGLHSLGHRPTFVILHVFQRPKGLAVYLQIKRSALQVFAGIMLTLPGPLAQAGQSNGPLGRNRRISFNENASQRCPLGLIVPAEATGQKDRSIRLHLS
jgi:hypothetical protein